ncbi:MAG: ABC transporter permease [Clostridia bacterium]|nr:ABC transporter permease [Clostridia bacterium]
MKEEVRRDARLIMRKIQDNVIFRALKGVWNMKESGIIIPTILYAIFVQIMNPIFFSVSNVGNLLRQTGFVLIPAIGMTMVLIVGGIDLSVGSVLALACVSSGLLMMKVVWPAWMPVWLPILLAILLAILIGAFIGLINGTVILKFGTPPMIMTLGMMFMARGMVYISTKGLPVYPLPKEFMRIEQTSWFSIPTIVYLSLVLCVFFHIVLAHTTFGRSVYAIGGSRDAAKLSGIPIGRISITVFTICSAMAAIAGIMMGSRLGSAQPSVGTSHEMNVIAACIVGGTSTFGGRGTILGTAVGALFMSMLTNSMTLMKVDIYWQNLAIGAVLVIAVILDQYKRAAAERGTKAAAL